MKRNRKLLSDLIEKLSTKDNKIKMAVGSELVKHFSEGEFSLDSEDFGILVHEMVVWLRSSSRIVVECSIDILILVIERLPSHFKQYVHLVFGAVTDRLGDNKVTVRQKAKLFILKLIERDIITPQNTIERLTTAFTQKNSKIREEVLNCIQIITSEFSDQQFLTRHLDSILRLLNDPVLNVRDAAINTIIVLYRTIGDKLRLDLQSKYDINPEKLQILLSKFDEVQKPLVAQNSREFKVPVRKYDSGKSISDYEGSCEKVSRTINTLLRPTATPPEPSSAIDEQDVLKSFENIPKVNVGTVHDLETVLTTIKNVIRDSNEEWSKRVEHLKKLRALVKAGWGKQEEFVSEIRHMVSSFDMAVRDLRSQVVRETCYTICYLAQELGLKLDHFSEIILISLINLIQNSVKVIASAALITIVFILKNVQHGKLIPIILVSLNSKSKEIRRACYDFIEFILNYWSTLDVERHVDQFQEAIKKGIADADAAARSSARKAFKAFENRFPNNAAHLIDTLDPTRRKILMEVSSGVPIRYPKQKRNRVSYSEEGEPSEQDNIQYRSYPCVRLSSSALFPNYSVKGEEVQNYAFRPTAQNPGSLSRPGTPSRRDVDVQRRSASFPGVATHLPRRKIAAYRTSNDEDKRLLLIESEDAIVYQCELNSSGMTSSTNSSLRVSDVPMINVSQGGMEDENLTIFAASSLLSTELNEVNSESQTAEENCSNSEQKSYEAGNAFSTTSNFINKCKSSNWFVRKFGLHALQNYLLKGNRLNPHELQQAADVFCNMFTDEHTKSLSAFLDALDELILTHYDDLGKWLFEILRNLFDKLNTDILATVRDKIRQSLSIVSRSFPPAMQYVSVFRYLCSLTQTPDSKCQVAIMEHLVDISSRVNFANLTVDTNLIIPALEKMIIWYHCAKSRKIMEVSGVAIKATLEINLPHINFILSSLPLEYRETVFMFLSGQSSSNRSKSLRRSPTTPHSCPQFLSSSDGAKLLKRQENNLCKREITLSTNEMNDVTQTSRRFRRFHSDNNINNKLSSINLKRCSDQRQHLLNAIQTLKVNNKGCLKKSVLECKTAVSFIKALVHSNHCCIIADEFKLVLKALLCLLSSKDNGLRIDVLGVFSAMFSSTFLLPYFANYTELMVLRVLNAYVDSDKKVAIAADSCATAMGANASADQLIYVLCPLIRMGNFPMNYSAIKMLTKVIQSNARAVIRKHLQEIMRVLLEEYDDDEFTVRKATVMCIVATNSIVGNGILQPYLSTLRESKLKLLNFYIDNNECK